MKVYRTSVEPQDYEWHGTFKSAHEAAKKLTPREQARIEECEVETDKANVIRILNGSGGDGEVLNTWAITPRGGTKPVKNGE